MSRLKRVDLPTLGRPTMATNPKLHSGDRSCACAAKVFNGVFLRGFHPLWHGRWWDQVQAKSFNRRFTPIIADKKWQSAERKAQSVHF